MKYYRNLNAKIIRNDDKRIIFIPRTGFAVNHILYTIFVLIISLIYSSILILLIGLVFVFFFFYSNEWELDLVNSNLTLHKKIFNINIYTKTISFDDIDEVIFVRSRFNRTSISGKQLNDFDLKIRSKEQLITIRRYSDYEILSDLFEVMKNRLPHRIRYVTEL